VQPASGAARAAIITPRSMPSIENAPAINQRMPARSTTARNAGVSTASWSSSTSCSAA
jgi:hypothetical protein